MARPTKMMDFKDFSDKYLNKPFKLNKTQKEFIKMIERNPNRRMIITRRPPGFYDG